MASEPVDQPILPANPERRKQVMGGIFLIAAGAFCAYFFMYRPVHSALTGNGQLEYYLKGIMLPPMCIYAGVLVLAGLVRDGELRTLNAKGNLTLTRKGWWFMGGLIAVVLVTFAGWYAYLNALGFHEAP